MHMLDGAVDYSKPVDASVWVEAMAKRVSIPQPIYDDMFYRTCKLRVANHLNLDIDVDINVQNCVSVFESLSDWSHVTPLV